MFPGGTVKHVKPFLKQFQFNVICFWACFWIGKLENMGVTALRRDVYASMIPAKP